jgi:hypothetical protein
VKALEVYWVITEKIQTPTGTTKEVTAVWKRGFTSKMYQDI